MNIPTIPIKSKGYFGFKVVSGGEVTKESELPTPNLLLDAFFAMLAAQTAAIDAAVIRVGTGSAPRTTGMTALTAQATLQSGTWPQAVATHGNLTFDSAAGNYVGYSTYVSTFAIGQLVGNFSEWGVEFTTNTTAGRTSIHATSLIKDAQGNPITLQLTASEQLIVTYVLETRISPQDYSASGVVKLDGVDQPITVLGRWADFTKTVTQYYGPSMSLTAKSGPIGPSGSALGGTTLGTKSGSIITGGATRIMRVTLGSSEWNFANGIEFIEANANLIKYSFSPGIPKQLGRSATIDITVTYGRL